MAVSDHDVAEACAAARIEGRVAFDTEFLREKTYRARLCLVQITAGDGVVLIDPIGGPELRPIAVLLADPAVEVIVHAGRQDFEIFHDAYQVTPKQVFDVQIAAAFAGFGANLPYGKLVEAVLGTVLKKGEAYTDWCRRPLSSAQTAYAADDVRYLIPLADALRANLRQRGREEWLTDEMHELEEPALYQNSPEEAYKRVSGQGSLSGRQLAVLKELARWREQEAARRDLPRGWIVKDVSLIELARRAPTDRSGLKAVRGLNEKMIERAAPAVLAAIQAGLAAPPVERPRAPDRQLAARARAVATLADPVIRARADAAHIARELVVTRDELEAFLMDAFTGADLTRHSLWQGWRRELVGDVVMALAEGRIALRATDRAPFVAEVPSG
ncbi:MAG TPA: ribonuclease D [Actinomycetota bacterium]|nr:ribonuclease D [Actinomycetota bacterium]